LFALPDFAWSIMSRYHLIAEMLPLEENIFGEKGFSWSAFQKRKWISYKPFNNSVQVTLTEASMFSSPPHFEENHSTF
jgi:hypothetical protein